MLGSFTKKTVSETTRYQIIDQLYLDELASVNRAFDGPVERCIKTLGTRLVAGLTFIMSTLIACRRVKKLRR